MSKKAERANKAQAQALLGLLDDIVQQGTRVVEDIQFIIECSGTPQPIDLDLSLSGLKAVETFYRDSMARGTPIEFGSENFEKLMGIMLGEYMIQTSGAHWNIYRGKYYVFHPIVLQLPDDKCVDVFVYCYRLSQKPGVSGAFSGNSLCTFVQRVNKMSFE